MKSKEKWSNFPNFDWFTQLNKSIISPSGKMFAMSTSQTLAKCPYNWKLTELALFRCVAQHLFRLSMIHVTALPFVHLNLQPSHSDAILFECLIRRSFVSFSSLQKGLLGLCNRFWHCPIASLPIEFNNVRIKDLFLSLYLLIACCLCVAFFIQSNVQNILFSHECLDFPGKTN